MWQMRRSRGPSLAEESSMEELTDTMKNFAMQFTGEVKSSLDLPFFEEIAGRGEELNYTIDSLRPIDPISDLVLGIGSYLGETIINEGKKNYRWCPFQIYVQAFPEVRNILGEEPDINTFALCVRENGKMCMPLNKISRFLFEGPQHNLEFFVTEQLSDLR
jgi:hypothetical protein